MRSPYDSLDEVADNFPDRFFDEVNVEAFMFQEREHQRVRIEQLLNDRNRQKSN